jgi:glycerate-2-kinase
MIITNFQKLAKSFLSVRQAGFRKSALLIAEAGYEAIDITKTVSQRIKLKNDKLSICGAMLYHSAAKCLDIDLCNYKRVFIVGIGKGSALASLTLAKILGRRLTGGIALDVNKKFKVQSRPSGDSPKTKLKVLTGVHPLPSKQNVRATKEIIKLAEGLKKDDLLITFICGGGSALLCGSEKELKNSILATKLLTQAGADIKKLNIVRKHLSIVKGGGLAKAAYPATVVSLIVSDVPTANNDLSMVASGPTVYDKTRKKDAEKIIRKNLRKSAHQSALIRDLTETPKDKRYFKKIKNILFLSNREPILAMAEKAEKLGLKPKIYSLKIQGEAKNAILPLMKVTRKGEAVLAGGETIVKLKVKKFGKGGRNMEAVLGAIAQIPNSKYQIPNNLVVISFASDGRDNTEAAGAIGDILTLKKAEKLKIKPEDFLNNHNSFRFFEKTGDLIYTKKKSFNVADLMIILKK